MERTSGQFALCKRQGDDGEGKPIGVALSPLSEEWTLIWKPLACGRERQIRPLIRRSAKSNNPWRFQAEIETPVLAQRELHQNSIHNQLTSERSGK
jgi:hypothetical protein